MNHGVFRKEGFIGPLSHVGQGLKSKVESWLPCSLVAIPVHRFAGVSVCLSGVSEARNNLLLR